MEVDREGAGKAEVRRLAEAMGRRRLIKPPDVLSALRVPLAVGFLLFETAVVRFVILGIVALTDLADGFWARRIGSSRIGGVLDAVVDKLFMVTAFFVVWRSGELTLIETFAAVLRDVLAALGFVVSWMLGRPTTVPARIGGKAVTVCQGLTLIAFLAGSELLRPLVWATGAISLYAVVDYGNVAWRR